MCLKNNYQLKKKKKKKKMKLIQEWHLVMDEVQLIVTETLKTRFEKLQLNK